MDTSIFNYGELPEFKNFTPENISKHFPLVLEKIAEDFKNIVNEFIIKYKGFEYAFEKMNEFKNNALKLLEDFPQNDSNNSIKILIDYIIERKY